MNNDKVVSWNDFWLYAKNHYGEYSSEKLNKIHQFLCGGPIEERHTVILLLGIVSDELTKESNSPHLFYNFVCSLNDRVIFVGDVDNRSFNERVIEACLSYMKFKQILDENDNVIFNIGIVNPKLVEYLKEIENEEATKENQ